MQLIILAALLATLAHSDAIPSAITATPAGWEQWRLLFVLLTTLAAPFATACDAGWFVARLNRLPPAEQGQWTQAGERYERLQLAGLWLWLAGSLAVIYLWDWPALVRVSWGWRDWPLLDEALILLPVVGSLWLVWMTFYYVERAAQRLRPTAGRGTSLLAYLLWNTRHYLAMALVPAFVVLAGQELAARYAVAAAAWWLAIPAVVLVPIALPLLLRRLWPTVELPAGELRERLTAITQQTQTPVTRMLIWQTQGRMSNAAVAGLCKFCRYLFLTDALLVQLTADEIAAVVRHELGHLQRRHLLQRLVLLALPLLTWLAVRPFAGWSEDLLATSSPYSLAVAIVYLAYAVLAVGTYSRWLEYDADLCAVLDERNRVDAGSARDLVHALAVLQGPHRESRFAHWLHPPTASRIAWLRRGLLQPAESLAYRQRMERLASALYMLTGFLIALVALTNARAVGG